MISDDQIELLSDLFRNRYGLVVDAAYRFAPSEDMIDDIVQQTYLDFITQVATKNWDLNRDVGPLLYQIAKRKAQWAWRRRQRENSTPVDQVADVLIVSNANDDDWEKNRRKQSALMECIKQLSPKSREMIELHYFEGVSMKEISLEKEVDSSTIRHFISRIRLKLRDCILRSLENVKDEL